MGFTELTAAPEMTDEERQEAEEYSKFMTLCTCDRDPYPCRFCFYGACIECYEPDQEVNPEPYCQCGY